jgi:hypothetical protein
LTRAAALAAAALTLGGVALAWAETRPDPAAAVLDGCGTERFAIFNREEPNWAYVYDRETKAADPPPAGRWVSGVAAPGDDSPLGVHPTPVDDPITHDSYDLIVNLRPDGPDAYLLGGDETARTGNFAGRGDENESEATARLHMEREEVGIPFGVWPEQGDRVQAYGSWVWDCEHATTGARTEFHPIRALWVERRFSPRSPTGEAEASLWYSNAKTPAGVLADCAHRTKGDRQAFKTCQATERASSSFADSGSRSFVLRAPPRPGRAARLRARLVDAGSGRGSPRPRLALTRDGVRVTLGFVAGGTVRVAYHVFVGWMRTPASARPRHLRLQLEELLVRRAMDPSCNTTEPNCPASVETTQLGQISTAPGEWALYVDVGGIWAHVKPLVLRVRDGQRVRLRERFDFYVPRGRPWRLFAFARECDFGLPTFSSNDRAVYPCPRSGEFGHPTGDDKPGYVTAKGSLGRHRANSSLEQSTCPRVNMLGCFRLTWRVTEVRRKGG